MLEQLPRLTVTLAHGVVNAGHEGPSELVRAFERAERKEGEDASRLILQDARKAANSFGKDSDKRLGPAISRRVYKVFMGKDSGTRDGIA